MRSGMEEVILFGLQRMVFGTDINRKESDLFGDAPKPCLAFYFSARVSTEALNVKECRELWYYAIFSLHIAMGCV
jgi:hypothetical protein